MSLENIARATLAGQNAPAVLHASEQAFLNQNILRIRDYVMGDPTSGGGGGLGIRDFFAIGYGTTTRPEELRGPVCLESEDPARTVSEMNKFDDNRVFSFLNIDNLELAALQPKVELRKIVYDINNVASEQNVEVYEGVIPFKRSSMGAIGNITEPRPQRADDVQIYNVEFDLKNQNPLGAGRIVGVRLDLLMSKGESLTKTRSLINGTRQSASSIADSELKSFKFTDLFRASYAFDAKRYDRKEYQIRMNIGWKYPETLTDVINNLGGGLTGVDRSTLSSQEISLNLQLVNYDISFRQDGKLILSLDYMSIIEDIYEDEQTNIFGGGFGFGTDENNTAEIINLASRLKKANQQIQQAKVDRQELQEQLDAISTTSVGTPANQATLRKKIQAIDAAIADANARKAPIESDLNAATSGRASARRQAQNNVLVYSRLLKKIYERRRMFSFSIPKIKLAQYSEEFQKNLLAADPSLFIDNLVSLRGTSVGIFDSLAAPPGTATTSFFRSRGGRTVSFAGSLSDQVNLLPEVSSRPDSESRIKAVTNLNGNSFSKAFRNVEARTNQLIFDDTRGFPASTHRPDAVVSNPDMHTFYFMFYGDLISAAMGLDQSYVVGNMVNERIGIILNSVFYTKHYNIPALARPTTMSLAAIAHTLPEDININLAYVPITLENYFNFFKSEVIDKKRTKYPIGEFIKDTLTKLVAPALNLKYFGQEPADKLVIKANTVDVSRKNVGSSLDASFNPILTIINNNRGPLYGTIGPYISVDSITHPIVEDLFVNSKRNMHRLTKRERFTYLNCYGSTSTSLDSIALRDSYRGDYDEDLRRGIYHLTPSADSGLLKDIKFSKRAMKYLAEASVFDSMQDEDSRYTRLWNVFDIEVVMVGNNLFKPGSLLYIDTSTTGLGNPSSVSSVSRFLGLGGYYLVTSVSNSVVSSGKGKWETRVKAIWQSSGRNFT